MSEPIPTPPLSPPDPFQILGGLLNRVVGALFTMSYPAARSRQVMLGGIIVLAWTILAFLGHPVSDWQRLFLGTFNPAITPDVANPMFELIRQILGAYLAFNTLGHLVAFGLPFWFTLRVSAIFLADVYELKQVSVAERFITQAAFAYPGFGMLHIENGTVRKSEEESPMFLIGGPGRVQVNLENVGLFEKIDGTPEVIGPTADQMSYTRTIDGFEKLRKIIDIRDHTVTLDLEARTKDGIHIQAENVRILFSVRRTTSLSTLARPYPYDPQGILSLVYDQGEGPWDAAMRGLVRGSLIAFISDYTFGEIFAAPGEPEMRRSIERQVQVQRLVFQQRNRGRRYKALNTLRAGAARAVLNGSLSRLRPARKFPKARHPAEMSTRRPRPYRSPFRDAPARAGKQAAQYLSPGGLYMHRPVRPAAWKAWVPLPYPGGGPGGRRFSKAARPQQTFRREAIIPEAAPPFVSRLQISESFYNNFIRNFPSRAQQRGVRLEWIDIGTWHVPDPLLQSMHNEAWNLTMENRLRSAPPVLEELRLNGRTQEQIRLLRRPLYRFLELNQQGASREEVVYRLIEDMLSVLRTARDGALGEGAPLPSGMNTTIEHILRYQRRFVENGRGRYIGS